MTSGAMWVRPSTATCIDEVKNEMKMEGTKREDFYALATKGEAGSSL